MPSQDHSASELAELIGLRRSLIRLQDETRLLRRHLLQRKYSPGQPRVPAGNTGGGRWTSGESGGGPRAGFGFGMGAGGEPGEPDSDGGIVYETGGDEAWSSSREGWSDDGAIFERDVVNRDGSTIRSEYAASRTAGFDERQTVTLNSGEKVTFETTGREQTIRYGGMDGEVVSRAIWDPDAPEPLASIHDAKWRRGGSGSSPWSEAGGKLFGWLNALGNATGLETVLGFRANDYTPGRAGSFDVSFVGQISREEVERACPYMPQIQDRLDKAARDAGSPDDFANMQKYGTDVHVRLKREIDAWKNSDVVAERSYFKELREMGEQPYGTAGTARFDVYEKVSDGTRCLYDIKTGRPLSRSQSDIIADAAMRIDGFVRRLLVIELRPRL